MTTMTDNQYVIDAVCYYVLLQAPHYGLDTLMVVNNEFDPFIPEGITYVVARGALILDSQLPIFIVSNDALGWKIQNPPRLAVAIPELVFRINADGSVQRADGATATVFGGMLVIDKATIPSILHK